MTVGMWKQVVQTTPASYGTCGEECPVDRVSWLDARAFARRLSELEGVVYRLPTEAEWEYAARGGDPFPFSGGVRPRSVGWVPLATGWHSSTEYPPTHSGCAKTRNSSGLCDMTGNVSEWTEDWYGPYAPGIQVDPQGPDTGKVKVRRGGGTNSTTRSSDDPSSYDHLRVAYRACSHPADRLRGVGFRLVREEVP